MAKITNQDIKDLGFTRELFNRKSDTEFNTFIDGAISDEAASLEGRIGSTQYASADVTTAKYVKNAEKCLVAAEMVQRRINVILSANVGAGKEFSTSAERQQRKDYLDKAEEWISKIVNSVTTDVQTFSTGALVTSHFE